MKHKAAAVEKLVVAKWKAKPFTRTAAPDLVGKGPFYEIKRAELVALIATRSKRRPGDDDASMHNKASAKVDYYTRKKGKLKATTAGTFQLGAFAKLARGIWPGIFGDVPAFPVSGGASLALGAFGVAADGFNHDVTLPAAIQEILVSASGKDRTAGGKCDAETGTRCNTGGAAGSHRRCQKTGRIEQEERKAGSRDERAADS